MLKKLKMAGFVGGIILIGATLIGGCGEVAVLVDRNACKEYGERWGRYTEYQRYNYFQTECMTRAADGNLIPIEQLRDEVR